MKNFFLFILLLSLSFNTSAQVVTGVYKGKMEVDSPRYTVDFELTLKEKDGKLYGYCHRLFIVDDILYYNLVKVNARIADSVLIVEDEKSVSNNFKEKTKGVKTVFFFKLKDIEDSSAVLPGEWSTSRWKNFLPITGKVAVNREQNYLATQLYKRLEDNGLSKDMAFEERTKPQPVVAVVPTKPTVQTKVDTIQTIAGKVGNETKPQTNAPSGVGNEPKQNNPLPPVVSIPTIITKTDSAQITKTNTPKEQTVTNQPKQNTDVAVNKPKEKPVVTQPDNQPKPQTNKPVVVNQPKQNTDVAVNKPKEQPVVTQPVNQPKPQTNKPVTNAPNKNQPVTVKTETKPIAPVLPTDKPNTDVVKIGTIVNDSSNASKPVVNKNQLPVINNPIIIKRTTEIIQAYDFSEDSVVLALYDNGEIDGDTVSVFLNNELLVSKVGLTAKAFKKTIYFKPGEMIQLTLFADNLGAIPPNTGLLLITTTNERYQVYFSSTLNKSSSVLLRRKEN
jgi:hypothetical protein